MRVTMISQMIDWPKGLHSKRNRCTGWSSRMLICHISKGNLVPPSTRPKQVSSIQCQRQVSKHNNIHCHLSQEMLARLLEMDAIMNGVCGDQPCRWQHYRCITVTPHRCLCNVRRRVIIGPTEWPRGCVSWAPPPSTPSVFNPLCYWK